MTLTILLFIAGLGLLILGAEWFVTRASRLAALLRISPLIIGLTVVSYGTSAPELAVTVQAVFNGQPDLAIGNVVGSNISNILFILGLSALAAPLAVRQRIIQIEAPLVIGISIIVLAWAWDGSLDRWEGLLLGLGSVAYTVFAIYESRREKQAIRDEYAQEYSREALHVPAAGQALVNVFGMLAGLGLLVLGGRWVVDGATAIARLLGLSELVIGLTVVSVGTSLPELATSLVAARRGEGDIALGNLVGSNLFNLLAVLGITATLAPGGLPVSLGVRSFDLPVMVAVMVASLPLFFHGYTIYRWEGLLLVSYYLAYTLYLIFTSTGHDLLPVFSAVIVRFVLPLTVLLLVLLLIRSARQPNRAPDPAR